MPIWLANQKKQDDPSEPCAGSRRLAALRSRHCKAWSLAGWEERAIVMTAWSYSRYFEGAGSLIVRSGF